MYNVTAYQIAKAINIVSCKTHLKWELLFQDSDELYYKTGTDSFLYIFEFGMISFFNTNHSDSIHIINSLKPYCVNYFSEKLSEEVHVTISPNVLKVGFNIITLPNIDYEMLRLVLLNTSQSVALQRYSEITVELLTETSIQNILKKMGN